MWPSPEHPTAWPGWKSIQNLKICFPLVFWIDFSTWLLMFQHTVSQLEMVFLLLAHSLNYKLHCQTKHNKWIVHINRSGSVKWHIFFHGLESEESRTLPGWASEAVFNIVMRCLISLTWSITVKLEATQGSSEKTHDCNFCENKSGSLSKPLNNLLSYGEISTHYHLI